MLERPQFRQATVLALDQLKVSTVLTRPQSLQRYS
jgi:hypothetical protein